MLAIYHIAALQAPLFALISEVSHSPNLKGHSLQLLLDLKLSTFVTDYPLERHRRLAQLLPRL